MAKPLQARGAYLSRIGNCMVPYGTGWPAYAGGHRLYTSIGTFITPNITPDSETGIGHWNEDDLWRAPGGQGRQGAPLYPAFPIRSIQRSRARTPMPFSPIFSLPPVEQKSAKRDPLSFQSSPAHLYLACVI